LGIAVRYAEHLASSGVERGLIGPREVPRIWDRHILNCAVVGELIPRESNVVDVGSGAGLPGLVLAIARPDLQVTLVEPLLRRAVWLGEVIADLQLTGVVVIRERAESLAGRVQGDLVTARAVAPLVRLVSWCLPLVRPGGAILAIKGRTAAEELASGEDELRALGVLSAETMLTGAELLPDPTTVVRLRIGPSAAGAPRRTWPAG
jgi:16S rRNA (guanine527-N7)-methyltransferase